MRSDSTNPVIRAVYEKDYGFFARLRMTKGGWRKKGRKYRFSFGIYPPAPFLALPPTLKLYGQAAREGERFFRRFGSYPRSPNLRLVNLTKNEQDTIIT
jgi:hypothetical protein